MEEPRREENTSILTEKDHRHESFNTKALREVVHAAKALACEQDIERIFGDLEKIGDMERDAEMKVERITSLENELEKQAAVHQTTHQQSLLTYTDSLDKIRSRHNSSKAHVATLQGELEQKDHIITTLREDYAKVGEKLQKSNQSSKDLEESLNDRSTKVKSLEQSVEELKAKNSASATALKQQEVQVSQLQSQIQRRQVEYDDLNKQYQRARQQVDDAQSLTVGLNSGEPEQL